MERRRTRRLIVEVASPCTKDYDGGERLNVYAKPVSRATGAVVQEPPAVHVHRLLDGKMYTRDLRVAAGEILDVDEPFPVTIEPAGRLG